MEFIFLIIGLICGIVIGWLVSAMMAKKNKTYTEDEYRDLQLKNEQYQTNSKVAEERAMLILKQSEEFKSELEIERNKVMQYSTELASNKKELENLNNKLIEQKNEFEALQQKFSAEFKVLANEILEEKSKKFTELNKINIDQILKPLGEKIRDFEKKVEETYDKESKQRFSLEKEIKNLFDLNQQVSKEAQNLTNALKGQAKTQGNWGEIILENILERSGLEKNREYFIQESVAAPDGKRFQPDVVIHYPGDRTVVIDSKVSLVAYERYCSSDEKEIQETALKEHINSIKNHINGLSEKSYQDLYNLKSLDFVMMFLPVEPAYLLAIQKDPELWNYAYEKRILLISPTNLIAALKMIVSLWRQEYQSRNALEIATQGGALYDKFVAFTEDIKSIGDKITATQKAYDAAFNKLIDGKGNLVKRVEELKKLGIKASKQIPQDLIDKSEPD